METVPILPFDTKKRQQRACLLCGLIKTFQQFYDEGEGIKLTQNVRLGCENCEEMLALRGSDNRVYVGTHDS